MWSLDGSFERQRENESVMLVNTLLAVALIYIVMAALFESILQEAIIEGSVSRLRPILMTVSTTVLGLLPLAFGTTQIGGDGPPYAPMAIAIIGGLVFSTLTSLFLVPYAYARLIGMRARWQRLCQHAQIKVSQLLPD